MRMYDRAPKCVNDRLDCLSRQRLSHEFVEPSRRHADVIVPFGRENRVAIGMLVARLRARVFEENESSSGSGGGFLAMRSGAPRATRAATPRTTTSPTAPATGATGTRAIRQPTRESRASGRSAAA